MGEVGGDDALWINIDDFISNECGNKYDTYAKWARMRDELKPVIQKIRGLCAAKTLMGSQGMSDGIRGADTYGGEEEVNTNQIGYSADDERRIEIGLPVFASLRDYETLIQLRERLNDILTNHEFLDAGIYDSLHLTIGGTQKELKRLKASMVEIRRIMTVMLGYIADEDRSEYFKMFRERIFTVSPPQSRSRVQGTVARELGQTRIFQLGGVRNIHFASIVSATAEWLTEIKKIGNDKDRLTQIDGVEGRIQAIRERSFFYILATMEEADFFKGAIWYELRYGDKESSDKRDAFYDFAGNNLKSKPSEQACDIIGAYAADVIRNGSSVGIEKEKEEEEEGIPSERQRMRNRIDSLPQEVQIPIMEKVKKILQSR